MDLDYWQEFYLLGEAEQVAERIRGQDRRPRRRGPRDPQPARLGPGAPGAPGPGRPAARVGLVPRRRATTSDPTDLAEALDALASARPAARSWPAARTSIRRTSAGRSTTTCSTSRAIAGLRGDPAHRRRLAIAATATWTDVRATRPAAAVRRAAARRAEIGGVQIQNTRHGRRQPLQRLAGRRRHAEAAGARCARSSCVSARARATAAGRRVRHRQPAHDRRAATSSSRPSSCPRPATRGAIDVRRSSGAGATS